MKEDRPDDVVRDKDLGRSVLPTLFGGAVIVAALYYGQELTVPLVLAALLAFVLGVVLGAVLALVQLALPSARRDSESWGLSKLPLGTFLCIGGIFSSLWGEQIIAVYRQWAGF